MKSTIIFLLFIGASVAVTAVVNPGIKTVITTKGLNYIDQVSFHLLNDYLQNLPIPDISGSSDVSLVGTIDYTVSNIKLNNIVLSSSNMATSSAGITVEVSGVSIDGSADWKYSNRGWIHISDDGTVDLSLSSVSFSVSAIAERNGTGHVTLRSTGCSLSIGSVTVDFHGGASWLYNLFDDTIEDSIKSSMQGQVCSAINKAINEKGSLVCQSIPNVIPVDEVAEVSYSLVSNPVFTDTYIETDFKGEFMSIAKPVEVGFYPSPFPAQPSSLTRMMYVWISDYVANSAGVVYHNAGVLQYTVTPDMIPSNMPIKLNTKLFEDIIPKVYKIFTDLDFEVVVKSVKPPTMMTQPDNIEFMFTGDVSVIASLKNKTKVNIFEIEMGIHCDVNTWIEEKANSKQSIVGNFTLIKVDLKLINSIVGNFSVDVLQSTVNTLVNAFGIPLLNKKVNGGMTLPVIDGLSFVKSKITFGSGYIMVGTDIDYNVGFMSSKRG